MKKRPLSTPSAGVRQSPPPERQPLQSGVRLSVVRAAARADVSTRTIKRWIKKGYLQAGRNPTDKGKGHLRIRLGDLKALLAGGTIR